MDCNYHFNTSHVSVNQTTLQVVWVVYRYFNTSHVSVNRNQMKGVVT